MPSITISVTVRTGPENNSDLGRIEVKAAIDGVDIGINPGRQDWCLPKDHGQREWDRSDYSPPKLCPSVHDSPFLQLPFPHDDYSLTPSPPLPDSVFATPTAIGQSAGQEQGRGLAVIPHLILVFLVSIAPIIAVWGVLRLILFFVEGRS